MVPFHTFLCKVHSRCNIDCDYCYMYHAADQSWRNQPKLMSEPVVRQTAQRIREHLVHHGKLATQIILHGGEPLLAGPRYLRRFMQTMKEVVGEVATVSFGIQSNGILITGDVIEICQQYGATIGISLDGPKWVNNIHRRDHRNLATYDRVEQGIEILLATDRRVFAGFLCTICLEADPLEVFHHLLRFNPPSIDFNYPLGNYDAPPPGRPPYTAQTPYADWLIPVFDEWYETRPVTVRIRKFYDLIRLMLGARSSVENFGLREIDFVVIETNGALEGVDTLKATYQGAPSIGLNVFDHSFDEALNCPSILARQQGLAALCDTCQQCPLVNICGGGYLPHRYHAETGFMNPDIYCPDHQRLIRHIQRRVRADLKSTATARIGATPSSSPPRQSSTLTS